MFSKLCLYTLASWFPEFLHHSTLFMLLEIQWRLCESLVYIFVPKVTQPHVCVFQMGNCNGNECGLLKHNVQIELLFCMLKQLLAMLLSYSEVYFFPVSLNVSFRLGWFLPIWAIQSGNDSVERGLLACKTTLKFHFKKRSFNSCESRQAYTL